MNKLTAAYVMNKRMKTYLNSQGINHTAYLVTSLFGRTVRGRCICGYKTKRFHSRAWALMFIDEHVDDSTFAARLDRIFAGALNQAVLASAHIPQQREAEASAKHLAWLITQESPMTDSKEQ